MASNPLQTAIDALVQAVRDASGYLNNIIHRPSPISGRPTGEPPTVAIARGFELLVPQLRGFSNELRLAIQATRHSREITARTARALARPALIPQTLQALSRSPLLEGHEQSAIARAARSVQGLQTRSQRQINAYWQSVTDVNEAQARYSAAQQATINARRRQAQLGQLGAFGPNFAATVAAQQAAHVQVQQAQANMNAARRAWLRTQANLGPANAAAQNMLQTGTRTVQQRARFEQFGAIAGFTRDMIRVQIDYVKNLTTAVDTVRKFADNLARANFYFAQFNPNIFQALVKLTMGDIRRGFAGGIATSDTAVKLAEAVNEMRDAWFAYDASTQNLLNRLGTSGALAISPAAGIYGQFFTDLDAWLKNSGIGTGQSPLETFTTDFFTFQAQIMTDLLRTGIDWLEKIYNGYARTFNNLSDFVEFLTLGKIAFGHLEKLVGMPQGAQKPDPLNAPIGLGDFAREMQRRAEAINQGPFRINPIPAAPRAPGRFP